MPGRPTPLVTNLSALRFSTCTGKNDGLTSSGSARDKPNGPLQRTLSPHFIELTGSNQQVIMAEIGGLFEAVNVLRDETFTKSQEMDCQILEVFIDNLYKQALLLTNFLLGKFFGLIQS